MGIERLGDLETTLRLECRAAAPAISGNETEMSAPRPRLHDTTVGADEQQSPVTVPLRFVDAATGEREVVPRFVEVRW
jgi:hypothetical protein